MTTGQGSSVSIGLRRVLLRVGMFGPMKALRDRRWLWQHRRVGSFSQFGEDVEVVRRLGRRGHYIDVGANHPFKASSTYLLYDLGWSGLTIEPIRSHCADHRRLRPRDRCVQAAAGREAGEREFVELSPSGFSTFDVEAAAELSRTNRAIEVGRYAVPVVRVIDAWRAEFGRERPDLLSIDTEGFEVEVLAGAMLAELRPRLLLVELQAAVGGRRDSLVALLRGEGYALVDTFGVNGLFERTAPLSESHPE